MPISSDSPAAYDIKSADLPLLAFQLKTVDLQAVGQALQAQMAESPGFFDGDPVLIDLNALPAEAGSIDFSVLLPLLRQHGLSPVGIKTTQKAWLQAALDAGLVAADDARIRRQVAVPAPQVPEPSTRPSPPMHAVVLDRPLRSGQQFYAKGQDLIVLSMVNPGAEVIADGHIHIYAALRGKAIAGARGFTGARIFAQSMDPELISIAGVYRTSEHALPASVRGQAAHVSLQSTTDGDKLLIVPIQI